MFTVALFARRPAGERDLHSVLETAGQSVTEREQVETGETILQFDDPEPALAIIESLARHPGVCMGLGAGSAEGRYRTTSRDHAMRALKRARARSGDMPVVIYGRAPEAAAWATSLAQLLYFSLTRRSEPGWEIVELVAKGQSQKNAAQELGITEQAVSQRLRAAGYRESRNIEPLFLCLLEEAARVPTR